MRLFSAGGKETMQRQNIYFGKDLHQGVLSTQEKEGKKTEVLK